MSLVGESVDQPKATSRTSAVVGRCMLAVAGLAVAALSAQLIYAGYAWFFHSQFYPAPPNAPAATAVCVDGSYSAARHRQGQCSYHGGVDGYFGRGPSRFRSIDASAWYSWSVMALILGGGAGLFLYDKRRVTCGFAPGKGRKTEQLWEECWVRIPAPLDEWSNGHPNERQAREWADQIAQCGWPITRNGPHSLTVTVPASSPLSAVWKSVHLTFWLYTRIEMKFTSNGETESKFKGIDAYCGLDPDWSSPRIRSEVARQRASFESGRSSREFPPYIGVGIAATKRGPWCGTNVGAEIGRLALRVLTEAEHEGSLPEPQRELTRWEPYPVSY